MNNCLFLIINLILILINIYLLNKLNNKESFTDLTPAQINVITNISPHLIAIKNLSDLATSLMNGKLTIPGGLEINGGLTVKGVANLLNNVNIESGLTVKGPANMQHTGNIEGGLTVKGITSLNNTLINNLTVAGESIIKGQLQVGTNLRVGNNLLTVENNLITMNAETTFKHRINYPNMKNMLGGFLRIQAYGNVMQLFYGWNIAWRDFERSGYLRTNIKWLGSSSHKYYNFLGLNMREAADSNWYPRILTILDGYHGKVYKDTGDRTYTSNGTIFTAGDHDLFEHDYYNKTSVSFIAISLMTDPYLPNLLDMKIVT